MMSKDDMMMSRNDYCNGRMREVIVIGAGTTGAAAAYHLAEHGVRDILVLDMGKAGMGSPTSGLVPAAVDGVGALLLPPWGAEGGESDYAPHNSGSAVFGGEAGRDGDDDDDDYGPRAIKMIVTLPPYLDLAGFASHHGEDGVDAYLDMARRGLEIEIDLARKVLPDPDRQVKRLGSLMVCEEGKIEVNKLRREYERLRKSRKVRCEWRDGRRVEAMHGKTTSFGAGIWLPDDGVEDGYYDDGRGGGGGQSRSWRTAPR